MNEYMLIELMNELDIKYLDNNYMEKDMNKRNFFSSFFHKQPKEKEEEIEQGENLIYFPGGEEIEEVVSDTLLSMGVDKKRMKGIYTIISGIAAAILVVFGVVLFIIKRYKRSGIIKVFKTI